MASPQLMVHWSASGEVFVRAADSGMQRLGFADGLAPLRYSALEANGVRRVAVQPGDIGWRNCAVGEWRLPHGP